MEPPLLARATRRPLAAANQPSAEQPPASAKPEASLTQHHTSWLDKQEAAFKGWLNTVLAPPAVVETAVDGGDDAGQPAALASRRLLARLRGLLWHLHSQDQELIGVMLKVERRIDSGQLRMQDEESVLRNVKLAAQARALLGSYHPVWLRLGAEVVVGRALAESDSPAQPAQVAAFLRDHFLSEPQLTRQHSPTSKPYWVALAKLVLNRVLLLAALLDRAVSSPSCPSGAPLLFRRDAKVKASSQVLLEFMQPRLAGEADPARTLGRLGYRLAHQQDPRWETDFAVRNLATDLRDGLRLCKLAEQLTARPGLFSSVRFPSDRRPVRLANLQLALDAFAAAGLCAGTRPGSAAAAAACPATAAELADGDRERTLHLLWRLLLCFQLPQLISLPAILAETELVRSKAAAAAAAGGSSAADPQEMAADPADGLAAESPYVAALLGWCAAVCARHGLVVCGFGACFADGAAFCTLIHHYLGHAYVPLRDVYRSLPQPAEACGSPAGPAGSAGGTAACGELPAGARRNFEMVAGVVASLGGIPPIVSAEDFVAHGHDGRACVLFTAFLCARLLEVSAEERAAMVVQRQWRRRRDARPGSARDHLHSWIAAATAVQKAVRAWLLRRGLARIAAARQRGGEAVVRLQALWRGRAARRRYQRQRQAAICFQAAWRGRQGRRAAFHERVLPAMLAAGLECKRRLEGCRYEARLARAAVMAQARWRGLQQRRAFLQQRAAAVAIQAAARGWLARRALQRQRRAALTLQSHWRGAAARRLVARQRRAATTLQAIWRSRRDRCAFLRQRAAAAAMQSAWRRARLRRLWQQQYAARRLQAAWRGHVARRRLAEQAAAATRIQAAWRRHAAEAALRRQRAAAVALQAAWRGASARRAYVAQRRAAVVVQAAWRGFLARRALQRDRAATALQSHVRGFMARRRLERRVAAAAAIQAAVRRWLAARRAASVAAVKGQMAEMAGLLREYQRRTAAALRIQAAYRGHRGRCEFRRRLAVRREAERARAEREAAALAVIAPYAHLFRDRVWFRRAQRAAALLQAWWREQYACRTAAATAIQAAARGWMAARRWRRTRSAALAVQRVWRGASVRGGHPRRRQLADIRLRLAAATASAASAPHLSLGARTQAHLDALLASKHPHLAVAALEGLALCTAAVPACGDMLVAGGGLPPLLGIARATCRSREAADALRPTLACLSNICRTRRHADAIFAAEGLLLALGDHLQQLRDKEDLFMAAVALWQRLVSAPSPGAADRAQALARQPLLLAKLEGVARVLALKQGADQKYLTKLEREKGSDVSARQATRALLATTRMLRALRAVLAATGASLEGAAGKEGGEGGELRLGRNTLVREAMREAK